MNSKIFSITILFSLLATALLAQEQDSVIVETDTTGFSIHSANISLGYYNPEMDYWNDTYLPAKGISEKINGSLTFGANLTFNLSTNFRARVGATYWAIEIEGENGESIDKCIDALKISLTRLNLGVMYAPVAISFKEFQPYFGAELESLFVKNNYDVNGAELRRNGSDIIFAPVVGIDRAFGVVNLGLEFKYNLGKYVQEEGVERIIEHDVSVNGPEVAIAIGYRF